MSASVLHLKNSSPPLKWQHHGVPLAQAKHKRTDLGAGVVGLRMLKATLNNSANLSLSSPVEEICEVSIAGGTSGGVGSFRVTSSVFAPALLVLKVIFAEGL